MGQSTNAILFYGYCWEEETSTPWTIGEDYDEDADGSGDWEKRYAAAKGATEPTSVYPNRRAKDGYSTPTDYTDAEKDIKAEYSAFWEKQRELVKESGCEVGQHCSGECPMPYVTVSASAITSYRGSMTEIKNLDVKPEWEGLLADFCEKLGIKTEGLKPAWWLVSYWG